MLYKGYVVDVKDERLQRIGYIDVQEGTAACRMICSALDFDCRGKARQRDVNQSTCGRSDPEMLSSGAEAAPSSALIWM